MKRTLSAFAALVAAVTLGALVLTVGPVGAHDSDNDNRGRMSGYGMMGHMMDQNMMRNMMEHMMGRGMMGPAMMSPGMGPCQTGQPDADKNLSTEDVSKMLQQRLDHWGNNRLKIGKIEQKDDDTIIAEIVTQDGSLVDRLAIDRDSGRQRRIK
ncbi:MAG: hypothetical protein V3U48_10370 [Rhodospirillales bacterium]